tara:strand:- start:617 stop:1789 length:1173 start_codon:yes stop_codon:yes gene_type:complete
MDYFYTTSTSTIPNCIVEADKKLHNILVRHAHFYNYLLPKYSDDSYKRLIDKGETPTFNYLPFSGSKANELLEPINKLEFDDQHPMGIELEKLIKNIKLWVHAITERTPAAFYELNLNSGWYDFNFLLEESMLKDIREGKGFYNCSAPWPREYDFFESQDKDRNASMSSTKLIAILKKELQHRGFKFWKVRQSKHMASPVTVVNGKRLIIVKSNLEFKKEIISRIIFHELDGHVHRRHNGLKQQLRCFDSGLARSSFTEEGLAMVTEEKAVGLDLSNMQNLFWLSKAISMADDANFYEIFDFLRNRIGDYHAWSGALRLKRGLESSQKGCLALDNAYLLGRHCVKDWLHDGGDIKHLYTGRVGIDNPVGDWLKEGWVSLQPVPDIWDVKQ